MKRALLLLLPLCVGCPSERPTPSFDNPGKASIGGPGAGPGSGGSGLTSVVAGTGSSTGAGMVANCECIYEATHATGSNCNTCVVTNTTGVSICATELAACNTDPNCQASLNMVCPNVPDTAAGVAQCLETLNPQSNATLLAYFNCLCSDPAPCGPDCHGGQNTCGGIGGAGGIGGGP